MITFLWAQTKDGVIGKEGKMPWKIKEEMQHFTNYTKNKAVLMGRTTWDSLYLKPLPDRKNIVITSKPIDQDYLDLGIEVYDDIKQAVEPFLDVDQELVVIGGKRIFDSLMGLADKLVVSIIVKDYEGDVYAPIWNIEKYDLTDTEIHDEFIINTYTIKKELNTED